VQDDTTRRRPCDASIRPCRARRTLALPLWLGGMALLAASAACGDGGDSAVSPASMMPVPSGGPPATSNPPPSNDDATPPSPAAESPPPAATDPDPTMPASEAMGMVPLDPPPMGDDASGGSGAEDVPPSDTPPADDPPADPGEDLPPDGPDPVEPEPGPPAFAPCPGDGSPCRIMPLGDSITFGIGARTPVFDQGGYRMELFRRARADGHAITFVGRQANGPMNIVNEPFPSAHEGYPGATINDGNNQLANRVDAAIAASDPDIILLMIGTNDVNGNVNNPPDDLRNLINQITGGAPDALLVVAQIVPTRTAGTNTRVQAYNTNVANLVRESAAAGRHVALVDMFSAFVNDANFAMALLNDDLHPSDTGYVVMAQTWYAAIEGVLR
jgi:lysophospholipase L1-like esterase